MPIALILGILGALLASFIGVISERIYTGQSWRHGRSKCNSCREELGFFDLVPVLSWIVWRGKCRQCRVRLPVRYVVGELVLGLLFVASFYRLGLTTPLVVFLIALSVLYFIVVYDLRHTVVPLGSSNALLVVSALYAFLTAASRDMFFHHVLVAAVISACFFALFYFSHGRAMGLGDTPVSFALSLLVGSSAVAGLMFSFWIGAVVGIAILLLRPGGPRMGIEVPFVPFMAAGYLLAYFTLWNPLPFLL